MVPTFSGCIVVIHWLLRTSVYFYFFLFLELKKVWYYLSSLSIQIGVFIETLHITLISGF